MDIQPKAMTVSTILGSRCRFEIPRFQREYSWERSHYHELLDDMLDGIRLEDDKLDVSSYFLGTMLFVGDINTKEKPLSVVDGQQRLTTLTILFSAISDRFIESGNEKLSERVFEYIMTEDDNGERVKILYSKTSYPYFQCFIQDRQKSERRKAESEEEECIEESYNYLFQRISEENVKNYLKNKLDDSKVMDLEYVDILKALRDQILNCTVVAIFTKEKRDANRIFEILNAKGKRLASVDLIKNKIFEILDKTEPMDLADDKWNSIKRLLYGGDNTVPMSTFFRHYWVTKYPRASESMLYDAFIRRTKPLTKDKCIALLDDLIVNAGYYSKILNPSISDYGNRKEYQWLVQSLNVITNWFNIVQIRILLMALFDAKKRGVLKTKDFKGLIRYLEGFHFAYNALLTRRPNVLDSIYSSSARAIRSCNSVDSMKVEIEELVKKIEDKYPTEQEFIDAFKKIRYSKKGENADNLKAKYILNRLYCFYSGNGQELFAQDGSVEHILPESSGDIAMSIGNLILLEQKINEEADDKPYEVKKLQYYPRSTYSWIKSFITEYDEWQESSVENRAIELAETFYQKILKDGN